MSSGPTLGPCSSWITGSDVASCCGLTECDPPSLFDSVAFEASMALYEISGRRFPGVCTQTVRPCADPCGCWGFSSGGGTWAWQPGDVSGGQPVALGYWRDVCGDRCGCGSLSRVKLSGYPVREITEVLIDGAPVDPIYGDGSPAWRIDDYQWLVRMQDPGPPLVAWQWPTCQNLALGDDQPGTFSITYQYGVDPPDLGRRAAADLACQLLLACLGSEECVIPENATQVTRQGVVIDRISLTSWFGGITAAGGRTRTSASGLLSLDLFMKAYAGPGRRPPAVWSPDVQSFARRQAV